MSSCGSALKIVHTEASGGWGGQEIRILEESRGMIRRGHSVTLLCPRETRIFGAAGDYGVPAVALPIGRKNLRGLMAMREWLGRNDADVINTHSSTDSWLTALACATMRSSPPLVRTRHISAPLRDNAATRWLYGKAVRHVVTTGERLREQVMREANVTADRVTSIPTGIDVGRYVPGDAQARRRELGLPADKIIVGIVATLRSWKGHDHLFAAFARMRRNDTLLLVVGDGPRRAHLERLAEEVGIAGSVLFVGQQADAAPWFQTLDLAVLPSYANEGVPQSLMQAMACGIPVVSTPVGAIGELIRDRESGRLVPPADPDALAAVIEELLADPAQRAHLASAAVSHVRQNHSIANMLDGMEAVFRAAIAEGVPG